MNKNKYRMEIDSIKASDRLKNRIIREVETMDGGEDKVEKFVRGFAGVAAMLGIAAVVFLVYKGGINSGDSKVIPGSHSGEEVTFESTTKTEENNSEHDMSLPENTALNPYIDDDTTVNTQNEKLKYTVTNSSKYTQVIMPEFWVMVVSDDVKKGYCLEELKPEGTTAPTIGDEIVIRPGEIATIDVYDEVMKKYSVLFKEEKQAYITFYTRRADDNKPTKILYLDTGLSMELYPNFINPYLEKSDDGLWFNLEGFRYNAFKGHIKCNLLRRNEETFEYELLGGINYEADIECNIPSEDGQLLYSENHFISLPSELEPGEYCIEFNIKEDETGFEAKRTQPFYILNDRYDSQIILEMVKDTYSMDEINNMEFRLEGTDGTEWKGVEYELYRYTGEEQYENMNFSGYVEFELGKEGVFNIFVPGGEDDNVQIKPGKYELYVTVDDGEYKEVGVGGYYTNVKRLRAEFEIIE